MNWLSYLIGKSVSDQRMNQAMIWILDLKSGIQKVLFTSLCSVIQMPDSKPDIIILVLIYLDR